MKVFEETGIMSQSAHFSWQNKDQALYGLLEGHKNSADELVEIVLNSGENIKKLDAYIFPIIFSYRHSIEISLKHIYLRVYGQLPSGGHNLLTLWDTINKEIVEKLISSNDFIEQVKQYKKHFFEYSLNGISLDKIRLLIKELQEANQRVEEVKTTRKQIDQNAEVWRYLISTDGELFFKCSHSIDYVSLKESIDYLYEVLGFIYFIVDEYLSG